MISIPFSQLRFDPKNAAKLQDEQKKTQIAASQAQSHIELQQAQIKQLGTMVEVEGPDGTIMRMPLALAQKVAPAAIAARSRQTVAKTNVQGRIDLQTLKGQSPLTIAQAHLANATADLKESINDPDSPAFQQAQQKIQWANAYKQAALNMRQQSLNMQREGLDYRENGPTASIKTQGQMSIALLDHTEKIRQEIQNLGAQGKLGPMAGRWSEFMAGKVGAGDPDFVELRTDLGLFQTALMKAHVGSRGSEMMMKHFQGLIDSGKMTPESLNAAMSSINGYLNTYVKQGQYTPPNRPVNSTTPAPAPPQQSKKWNATKGIYE